VIKAADVTKKQDMINLRDYILSTMPPIGGVANGAMLQANCFFSDLPYDALQEVLKPKVDGSLILDEIFSSDDLDVFLLFSSISAVVGQPFQANYDAANNVSFQIFGIISALILVVYDRLGVAETSSQPPSVCDQPWPDHRARIHSKYR
jgi:hypothetical protein